jgi:hypothetical protein
VDTEEQRAKVSRALARSRRRGPGAGGIWSLVLTLIESWLLFTLANAWFHSYPPPGRYQGLETLPGHLSFVTSLTLNWRALDTMVLSPDFCPSLGLPRDGGKDLCRVVRGPIPLPQDFGILKCSPCEAARADLMRFRPIPSAIGLRLAMMRDLPGEQQWVVLAATFFNLIIVCQLMHLTWASFRAARARRIPFTRAVVGEMLILLSVYLGAELTSWVTFHIQTRLPEG